MKLKELHSLMQDIQIFQQPKIELEQYATGPDIASRLLFTVDSVYNEFTGRTVVDLGCGTGMLAIGAALLGSGHVIGVDVDSDALELALDNSLEFENLEIDLVQCSVTQLLQAEACSPHLSASVVIMNPPFGTRTKGADIQFLRAAFKVSTHAIYSMHKSSTRPHIHQVATQQLGAASAEVLAELRYDLPASYVFHKQKTRDIAVDLWRFEVQPKD
eukprot:jgi/Astpho2/8394/fgenesh1_pm.00122_%23_28_t